MKIRIEKEKTKNDNIVTDEHSPTIITGITTSIELESLTVDAEDNMVIDGEAYNSQTNGADSGIMSELEPMNVETQENDKVKEA